MIDPLRREKYEAVAIVALFYLILLGSCVLPVWWFWR